MFRQIRRHPARALLVVATLALGLGATTAIVSAIYGVLLAPLGYPAPQQLVTVGEQDAEGDSPTVGTVGFTTFDDWKRSLRSFQSMAAVATRSYTLMGAGDPEPIDGLAISHDLFDTFGVRPRLGRDFEAADAVQGGPYRALISDELWRRRYGADRHIVGKSIRLGDTAVEVIGVMPPRTRIKEDEWRNHRVDVWVPLRYDVSLPHACRSCRHIRVFARLRDGITVDQAAREVETFTAGLRRTHPDSYPSRGSTTVQPLQSAVVGRQVASSLWTVLAVALLVFLAAVANAGSLRLSELFSRQNEIAVRQSLGATTFRLGAMLVAESAGLALLASLIGLVLAGAALGWMRERAMELVPRAADLTLDPRVASASVLLAVVAGAVIGLFPALRARRWTVRPSGRSVVSARSRAQQWLVGVNVALAVTMLVGGSLLLRSVWNLFSTPPGLDATNVTSFRLSLSGSRYETAKPILDLYDRFLAEARATAGVSAIALTSQLPFAEDQDNAGMNAEDRAGRERAGDAPDAQRFAVSPGYFDTLRIPILGGRAFTDGDLAKSEPVVILSERAVRALWPDGNAIGKRVQIGGGDDNPFRRVVGIAGDVAPGDLGAPRKAQAYVPLTQHVVSDVTGIVRSSGNPAALREVMRRLEPDAAFFRVSSLSTLIRASEGRRTFILATVGTFAAVTLVLAMIGVYGILSLLVTSRTRELGLRMALGSTGAGVFRLVLSEGLRLVSLAAAAGLAASFFLGRFLASMLYGVRNGDPVTLVGVTAALLVASTLACALPALRAARVSPIQALHEE